MAHRTYEADKYGRITVYPCLDSSARKSSGIFKAMIMKLLDLARVKKNAK
jgi:hypothetical protein